MAHAVDFKGSNFAFTAPPGEEERVGTLHVFRNGQCIVSCWELTDAEIEEIVRTRKVFHSVWSDGPRPMVFPIFIGSESVVRSVVVDFGKIW